VLLVVVETKAEEGAEVGHVLLKVSLHSCGKKKTSNCEVDAMGVITTSRG